MDRMISLSVGTTGDEDYFQTFQDMSELTQNLGASHDYVNVSASMIGPDVPEENDCPHEHVEYDENTVFKVGQVLRNHGLTQDGMNSVINDLQNVGILFRERPKTEG